MQIQRISNHSNTNIDVTTKTSGYSQKSFANSQDKISFLGQTHKSVRKFFKNARFYSDPQGYDVLTDRIQKAMSELHKNTILLVRKKSSRFLPLSTPSTDYFLCAKNTYINDELQIEKLGHKYGSGALDWCHIVTDEKMEEIMATLPHIDEMFFQRFKLFYCDGKPSYPKDIKFKQKLEKFLQDTNIDPNTGFKYC